MEAHYVRDLAVAKIALWCYLVKGHSYEKIMTASRHDHGSIAKAISIGEASSEREIGLDSYLQYY